MTAAENVALPLMFKGVDKRPSGPRPQRTEIHGSAGPRQPPATEMTRWPAAARRHCPRVRQQSQVIFADEPDSNLDSRTSKQVLYRMLEMSKNSGVTFVMVTHEPELAGCADRIVTILDGKVCSNVVQDEETKKKNRDALFADLEGNLDIGGEAAKEQKK